METRANFILIGAFTLAGLFGILGLFLWFAQVELDRQFAYYDVRFTSVSGLSDASDVRFSGLPVGQVVDVRLSPNQDGTILVRLEVDAATPVRSDSVATIEAQGVTGVSFVLISRGTVETPLLAPTNAQPVPEIEAGRSIFQSLSEDAPRLVNESLRVVEELGILFGAENQRRLDTILRNVEAASGSFASTLEDFSNVTGSVSEFATQIGQFNAILETLSEDLTGVLRTTDATLASIGALSDEAELALTTGTETLSAAQGTITAAERYITQDLTATTQELRVTVTQLRDEIAALSTDAQSLIATFEATGTSATARLEQAEGTLASVDVLLGQLTETATSVDQVTTRIDTLIQTEGAPLLAETRVAVADATAAIRTIGAAAQTDLPVMVADIQAATATAARVIEQVGADLTAASGRIDGLSLSAQDTLAQVVATFATANTTLEAVTKAVETGDRTLAAAERAFVGADRVINEDIDGIITGLEQSLDTLNTAIAQVADDIPAVTAEVRAASQSATAAFADLQGIIANSGPSVTRFASSGLPLYTRLAEETRGLIRNLDRLTQEIQRDPARFLLDRQSPEFRR